MQFFRKNKERSLDGKIIYYTGLAAIILLLIALGTIFLEPLSQWVPHKVINLGLFVGLNIAYGFPLTAPVLIMILSSIFFAEKIASSKIFRAFFLFLNLSLISLLSLLFFSLVF